MDLETLIANLPPEAIAALAAGQVPSASASAKAKAPRATKAKPAKATKPTTRPFRELEARPIVEPRRAGPLSGQRFALDRYTAKAFASATYRPEHMFGQFPAPGVHGVNLAHL